MRRDFIFLALVVVILVFPNSLGAQCPEDTTDLGDCDTLHVLAWPKTDTCFIACFMGNCDTICINDPGEYFPCFLYVSLFVTHDSNTFYWDDAGKWMQDSLSSFIVPLSFWHQPVSGMDADSVILPYSDPPVTPFWNNTVTSQYDPKFKRSIFRHLVEPFTGDTVFNRMAQMVNDEFLPAWTVNVDICNDSCPVGPDSIITPPHAFLSLLPVSGGCRRWWEGSRVLLATWTFMVYMDDAETTEVCFDAQRWPPAESLTVTRYDAKLYYPRSNLPICFKLYKDTVEFTGVRWIEGWSEEESKPTALLLSQNYPNPFNPVTNFKFTLPHASHVKIEIFNILGQRVKTLVDEDMKAGVYVADWNGKDKRGVEVSSGIYFYRIQAGEYSQIKKMVLVK